MKKLLQIPLLLVALFLTSIPISAEDFSVDGIYYSITSDKTVEVTYSGSSYDAVANEYTGSVVIPETVTNSGTTYAVTTIGEYAFYDCAGLTSVTIPNSVTTIGEYAFYDCAGLTSVTIPNSVTSIGVYAFYYCTGLTSIKVESGNAIYDSRDNCNAIIETASNTLVLGCKNTTIPNSVTSIGNSAFSYCRGLTSVTIPNSVTSIGYYAFGGCTGLTEVTIGNSVTSIGDRAFYGCSGLTSITIPNSVTSIGGSAFSYCHGLTSVTIPNSVISIGNFVFSYCRGLTSIKVESGNAVYDSRDNCNAIIETASNTLVLGCKNTTIPNSVTSIGNWAFYGCDSLTSITIPNSVTTIGDGVFSYCTGLTSVTIPNSVTFIGDMAFSDCAGLTEVTIGNSVTSIGGGAFFVCTGLTSVTIPNSVTSIGYAAFYGCTGLTEITSLNPEPPTCEDEDVFNSVSTECTLYVPSGSKNAYAAAAVWKNFTNIVELPSGIEDIEAGSNGVEEVARYDIHGRLLTEPTPGINIVKYSDGTTRKEIVK